MNRKPSMLVVFLTVFIDLIGFGIVVPLVPMYSRHYGASGWMIGAIIASFSAMQFVFSPIWGKLSDRYGRRPILLISTAGAACSYVIFAIGSGFSDHSLALGTLLVSRLFAGACGGNITVAQAYVADITPPENRSKRMGLIGMAFGLGFIFGPAISGVALKLWGKTGPGWTAAALCAANFILAYIILAESWKPNTTPVANRPRFAQWGHTLSQPKIGLLILIFFLATFAFSCFESTLPLLITDNFHLATIGEKITDTNNHAVVVAVSASVGIAAEENTPALTVVWLFVFCGLISAFVQGGMIGRLVKMFGEPKLICISLVMTGTSLVLLPLIHGEGPLHWSAVFHLADKPWIAMLAVLVLLSLGSSLSRAPLFGLLSNLTPATEQGATIGVAQSAGALARIVGPIFAATLYGLNDSTRALPYLICGSIAILAGLLTVRRLLAK